MLIRPFDENGKPVNYRVRADNVITGQPGGIKVIDAKASATAGFTKNQRKGYPLIGQYGGMIESGTLKGTKLNPTEIEIVRPIASAQ